MADKVKILGFAGSLRKGSFNKMLLRAAVEVAPEEVELKVFDLEGIPPFNQDLENTPHEKVKAFKAKVKAADGVLIVTPEYNHSYPAVLKNALDWGYLEFEKKPVALVGVSSGRFGGARAIEHLRPVMENYSMFAIRETVNFGPVSQAFDEQGKLIEERYIGQVNSLIDVLLQNAETMKVLREKK